MSSPSAVRPEIKKGVIMKALVERALETARLCGVSFADARVVPVRTQSIEFCSGSSSQEMGPMKMKILAVVILTLAVAA